MICGKNDLKMSLFRFLEVSQPFQGIFFVKEDPDFQPKVTRDVLEEDALEWLGNFKEAKQ